MSVFISVFYNTIFEFLRHYYFDYNLLLGHSHSALGGRPREIRAGDRVGGPRPATDADQDFLWLLHPVWRAAQHPCLSGVPGIAGSAAGIEPKSRGVCSAGGAGVELPDPGNFNFCPQELFLS